MSFAPHILHIVYHPISYVTYDKCQHIRPLQMEDVFHPIGAENPHTVSLVTSALFFDLHSFIFFYKAAFS